MAAQQINPVVDFAAQADLTESQSNVVRQVYDFVEEFFRNPRFDASHDFAHVQRVTKMAVLIFHEERRSRPLDGFTVLLGALLHDVEDKKYHHLEDGESSTIQQVLVGFGLSQDQARNIKRLVDGVSYSSEVKDPEKVHQLIEDIPELAVVQDADRLDAIGAIGIGRCFTFGGAKAVRNLDDSVQHFRHKLLKLEAMMKTETAKQMAAERSRRIGEFLAWWDDEHHD